MLNVESLLGSCQTRGKGQGEPGTTEVLTPTAGRSTDCGWGPSRLFLEEVDDLSSSHPLEAVLVPTPLYHRPHAIRDFTVNRSQWTVIIEDREDHRRFDPSSERGLPCEDLGPTSADDLLEVEGSEDSAHLPNKHGEREDVSGLGGACVD